MSDWSSGFFRSVLKNLRSYAPLLLGLLFIGMYIQRKFSKPPQVDPAWKKTIISIELAEGTGYRPHGTGFLVSTEFGTNVSERILVTARHLISSLTPEQRRLLAYRYRAKGGFTSVVKDADLVRDGAGDWVQHPRADVACRLLGTYRDGDTLATPTNLFLPVDQLRARAKVFLTRIRQEEATLDPAFERGVIVEIGEPIGIKAPVRRGFDGGPAVYVPDSYSLPLTHWNLTVLGLVSEVMPVRASSKDAKEGVYAVIPAVRIQEVVEQFREQKRSK